LSGRGVAVVVGATGGLGEALTRRLAAEGWRVVAAGRDAGRLASLAGAGVETVTADVRLQADVDACVECAVSRWGSLDLMVDAAGGSLAQLGGVDKPVTDLDDGDYDLVLDVNLRGAFHCVRAAGRRMKEQGGGHIILVASGSGIRPGVDSAAYAAAKAGVIGLMKAAARDLGPHNVRVNAVAPGFVPHQRMAEAAAGRFLDAYRQEAVLGRFSTAEEFGRLVAFLATAEHLSGQIINLDSRVLF